MRTKVQKWGNSLAVRIPKSVAIETQIRQDSIVDMTLVDGHIVMKAVESKNRYSLDDLLAGVTEDNLHSETDWGGPVGAEII